jgi:hypothetical protein
MAETIGAAPHAAHVLDIVAPFCWHCKEVIQVAKKCRTCRVAIYCGKECRRNDWIQENGHKIECPRTHKKQQKRPERSPARSDAIDLLIEDHRKVDELFRAIRQPESSRTVQRRIIEELRMHQDLEEQILYPFFRHVQRANSADD